MERTLAQLAEGHVWFNQEHNRLLAAQAVLPERLDRLIADQENRRQGPP
jgi:hypothetical protein